MIDWPRTKTIIEMLRDAHAELGRHYVAEEIYCAQRSCVH